MRRLVIVLTLLSIPSPAFAQMPPPQITNDDLLRLIGLQQVQNLQCGKALEAAQQALKFVQETPKPEEKKEP